MKISTFHEITVTNTHQGIIYYDFATSDEELCDTLSYLVKVFDNPHEYVTSSKLESVSKK